MKSFVFILIFISVCKVPPASSEGDSSSAAVAKAGVTSTSSKMSAFGLNGYWTLSEHGGNNACQITADEILIVHNSSRLDFAFIDNDPQAKTSDPYAVNGIHYYKINEGHRVHALPATFNKDQFRVYFNFRNFDVANDIDRFHCSYRRDPD